MKEGLNSPPPWRKIAPALAGRGIAFFGRLGVIGMAQWEAEETDGGMDGPPYVPITLTRAPTLTTEEIKDYYSKRDLPEQTLQCEPIPHILGVFEAHIFSISSSNFLSRSDAGFRAFSSPNPESLPFLPLLLSFFPPAIVTFLAESKKGSFSIKA